MTKRVVEGGGGRARLNPRVLVVEGHPDIRQIIRLALEAEELAVDAVESGQAALGRSPSSDLVLVVVNLRLPDLDGRFVMRALRERHGPELPIVLLTTDARLPVSTLSVGGCTLLRQPFAIEELVDAAWRAICAAPVPPRPTVTPLADRPAGAPHRGTGPA